MHDLEKKTCGVSMMHDLEKKTCGVSKEVEAEPSLHGAENIRSEKNRAFGFS
jgi:hypothetical protein